MTAVNGGLATLTSVKCRDALEQGLRPTCQHAWNDLSQKSGTIGMSRSGTDKTNKPRRRPKRVGERETFNSAAVDGFCEKHVENSDVAPQSWRRRDHESAFHHSRVKQPQSLSLTVCILGQAHCRLYGRACSRGEYRIACRRQKKDTSIAVNALLVRF